MIVAPGLIAVALGAAAPDGVPVQRPGSPEPAPTPEPAAPGPTDAAAPTIVPLGEEQITAPPTSDPVAPAPADPVEPAPGNAGEPIGSWRDAEPAPTAAWEELERRDRRPPFVPRGTAFFAVSAGGFATVVGKQLLSLTACDGATTLNCGGIGAVDRVALAAVIGLAAGGGWMRGTWAAEHGKVEHAPTTVRRRKVAGWTLAAVGFAAAAVDMSLAAACWGGGVGPLVDQRRSSEFVVRCLGTPTALAADGAAVLAGVGMALGTWANGWEQRKRELDGKASAHAALAPFTGRDRVGLSIGGRF
jgi:hypothetical protein